MQLCSELKILCSKYLEDTSYDYMFEKGNGNASFEKLEKARKRINNEKNKNSRKLRNVKKVDYSYMDMPSEFDLIDLTNNFDKYGWGTSYKNYCKITDKYSLYESKDPDYVYEEDYDDDEL